MWKVANVAKNHRSIDREQRIERLLDAAADQFLSVGYAGTTMAQIAHGAGITSAAVYWYYPSKDDALVAVQRRFSESMRERLDARHLEPMSRLETYLEMAREESRPLHQMLHERSRHSDAVSELLREVHDEIEEMIRAAVHVHDRSRSFNELEMIVDLSMATIEGTNATVAEVHSSDLVRWAIEQVVPFETDQSDSVAAQIDNREDTPSLAAPTPSAGDSEGDQIFADVARRPATARRLLVSAAREFAEHGFEVTTTRQICSGAGLSSTALYAHFASKEELLFDISVLGHQGALNVLHAAQAKQPGPVATFANVVHAFVRFHAVHHTLARVIQYELRVLSVDHLAEVAGIRRAIDRVLRTSLQAGVASGDFACTDVSGAALAIESLAIDVARWFSPAQSSRTPEELGLMYAEFALQIVQWRPSVNA